MSEESGKGKREREDLGSEDLTGRIIGAAIGVHRALGPGFLEALYEEALCIELGVLGLRYERQRAVPVFYRGRQVGEHRVDLLVEKQVVVELKAAKSLDAIHFAVVRSYLKALQLEVGLLLNFAVIPLTVRRAGREVPPREDTALPFSPFPDSSLSDA